jgi:hypothetical protein
MEIIIKRTYKENATYGDAEVYDPEKNESAFDFHTLELPWKDNQRRISCIPEGTYMVWKMKPTEKRPYEYFHVKDVPGRDAILFHPGNFTSQILGCVLPGEEFKDLNKDGFPDITNTTATLKILTALLPDKFKLTIQKA